MSVDSQGIGDQGTVTDFTRPRDHPLRYVPYLIHIGVCKRPDIGVFLINKRFVALPALSP
jgi:hypothetical protein